MFGDVGLGGGGAAGIEIDRYDLALGTPPHARVLASSEPFTDNYPLVQEEIYFMTPGLGGTQNPWVRADLVYFTTPDRRRGVLNRLDRLGQRAAARQLRQPGVAADQERGGRVYHPRRTSRHRIRLTPVVRSAQRREQAPQACHTDLRRARPGVPPALRRDGSRRVSRGGTHPDRCQSRSGIATGRIGEPVAPRSLMQAPMKANS